MKKKHKGILAINGGKRLLRRPWAPIHVVDEREVAAATRVIRRGPLSGFLGNTGRGFLGGPEVRRFEKEFSKKFKVKYAVAFNSATTALHGAVAALGVGPGDEVIVSPYTMSASVTAVLMNGAVPIFADVDERTFCLDVESVRRCITPRTKAIMVTDLMGQGPNFGKLLPLAKKHKLKVIEDNAQSPGATWRGKFLGTVGDIGVFSLNIHKTIRTGEGGVLVTNDSKLALRAQLCRNHGEAVVDDMPSYTGGPIFGSNYRMSEVIAAMACVQLTKLDFLTRKRIALAVHLTKRLKEIPGLIPHYTHPDNKNVYYRYAIRVDERVLGLSMHALVDAMRAEGFAMSRGYVKPIYLMKLFKERKAFNNTHFPFDYRGMRQQYRKGLCPVAERLHEKEFVFTDVCQHPYTNRHVDKFISGLKKVLARKDELQ